MPSSYLTICSRRALASSFVLNFVYLDRDRPQSRCICRERDAAPHSLLSTWDGAIIDDMPRSEGHLAGRLSRLVVKDPLLCMCLWETLMFIYRGKAPEHSEILPLYYTCDANTNLDWGRGLQRGAGNALGLV